MPFFLTYYSSNNPKICITTFNFSTANNKKCFLSSTSTN